MKTEQELYYEANNIIADERLWYPTATVFENAPLALIQSALQTKMHTIEWVLGIPLTGIGKHRKEKTKPKLYLKAVK